MTCSKKMSFCRSLLTERASSSTSKNSNHSAVIVAIMFEIVITGAGKQMQSHDHATR